MISTSICKCVFIAAIESFAKLWITHTEYTVSQKTIDEEMNTICDYRYVSSIPKKRKVFDFGYVYSIGTFEKPIIICSVKPSLKYS